MQIQGTEHSQHNLGGYGIHNVNAVYWNLATPRLVEEAIRRHEGRLAHLGSLVVRTGQHTGRASKDTFIVYEPSSADKIW